MNDLISRQAAITLPVFPKEYREYQTSNLDDAYEQGWMDCQEFIADLPSVEPKKGKWEMKPDPFEFFRDIPVCSECGCTTKMREKTKYCPNCGAKMETNRE